jgi:tetratricopeptide (TPR) repeat protein
VRPGILGALLALALLGAPAAAQDDDPLEGAGLDRGERAIFSRGARAEQRGDCDQAITAYGIVLSRNPGYVPATLGKARCLEALGRLEQALALYRTAPMEAAGVRGMGRILEELEEYEAAAEQYRTLQRLELGQPEPWLLEAAARIKAGQLEEGVDALERYLVLATEGGEAGEAGVDEERAGAVMIDLGAAFYEDEQPDRARSWYRRYLSEWPEGEHVEAVEDRLDRIDVEAKADELAGGIAEPLPIRARPLLERARTLVAGGQIQEAREGLEALLAEYGRAPEVWAAWGDLHAEAGAGEAVDEAERAYLTAVALAPDEPSYRLRLALLLAERYAGRRHDEAASQLRQALALRPTWYDLHYRLGVVQQERGDPEAAARAFQTYLAADPRGRFADDARARSRDLARPIPEPPDVTRLQAPRPEHISEEAWDHYRIARVYQNRNDDPQALEEIEQALELAPGWHDALNVLATLQIRAGEMAGARETYERSLAAEPAQPWKRLELGDMWLAQGDEARARQLYQEAAEQSVPDAWFALAQLDWREGDWREARRQLDAYFASSTGGLVHDEAEALRAALDRRWQVTAGAVTGAALLALGLPAGWLVRRRGVATLRDFLERSPEVYHDVAVILSAMRHEVLKHNTTVLPAVADALEEGEQGLALDAADRLFSREGRPGVIQRWRDYVEELEALARRAGVRVNLARDPDLGPMCEAFSELTRLEAGMVRGNARIAPRLRALSDALNEDGYRALGRLIRQVCVLEVDAALVQSCWERVRQEPAFAEQALPALELWVVADGEGAERYPVRIFRRDFEDILGNVLRNSLRAVLEDAGEDPPRLGALLEVEEDWVTGLESVVLRVLDNAARPLTDAMIRGRYIERGFGLTVDLINRHNGSIKVEGEDAGWSKAVVVRLPRAEGAEEDE